ncbi:MAG: FAD-dependent oxidoreductase [Oscillospiraceae bacterium]|jgi:2,4-dienoyl-CoA reductase-like NADH-dependent reductase (Old Yellow Enzyme family)/thioredoxin reductase|nr:FAD-dependent oxidoreductase [Oscillospiraceae bacterium]
MPQKTPFALKYPRLVSPLRVGNLALRSRMCSAPMGFPYITADGLVTNEMIAFYELRAKGGAAAVTVSEAVTHPTGKSHGRLLSLYADGALQGLTDLARAIKRHGAIASIELNHGGMYSEMDIPQGSRDFEIMKYGPSELILPDGKRVREMPNELIDDIVASFARGAELVRRAGFDMLMLHGGHGWLIEQFLSPAVNKRTDKYGGSLENRARLAIEIIDAVRAVVGTDFPIELRISGEEKIPGGYDIAGAVEFAKLIDAKIDLLHVSAGFGEDGFAVTHPSMFAPHGANVHLAAEIKRHVTVPVATVGGLGNPAEMERIISSGKADVVCMARALLADPELPRKVEANRDGEILRCLRCFTCHAERMLTQTRVCAINPVIGRELEGRFETPRGAKKYVLVVGGGPGGVTAALTAAQRGHSVILCEKRNELGGALLSEGGIPFKRPSLDFIKTREYQLRQAGVDIRFGAEVTPEFARRVAPDAIIVAVGAEPIVPSIPGIDGQNVIFAAALPEYATQVGERVVIIGGGLAGCETAVHLAQIGKMVTLVEMGSQLAPDANPRHGPILRGLVEELTKVYLNTRGVSLSAAGLVARTQSERPPQKPGAVIVRGVEFPRVAEFLIEADTIIVAAGAKPQRAISDALRFIAPETAFVGDCVQVKNIREAVFRGYHAALDL